MHISLEDLFCDKQSVASGKTTEVSTNILDWKIANRTELHFPLWFFCKAQNDAGANDRVTVSIESTDEDGALPTATWTPVCTGKQIQGWKAGDMLLDCPMPYDIGRYVRMKFTFASASSKALEFTGGIVRDGTDREYNTVTFA